MLGSGAFFLLINIKQAKCCPLTEVLLMYEFKYVWRLKTQHRKTNHWKKVLLTGNGDTEIVWSSHRLRRREKELLCGIAHSTVNFLKTRRLSLKCQSRRPGAWVEGRGNDWHFRLTPMAHYVNRQSYRTSGLQPIADTASRVLSGIRNVFVAREMESVPCRIDSSLCKLQVINSRHFRCRHGVLVTGP